MEKKYFKNDRFRKTISILIIGIFLCQQIAWAAPAGTPMDAPVREKFSGVSAQTIEVQQSIKDSLISQKQAIENFIHGELPDETPNTLITETSLENGTVLKNFMFDEDYNILDAEIDFLDGSELSIIDEKFVWSRDVNDTVFHFNNEFFMDNIELSDGSMFSCAYIKNEDNTIAETILMDDSASAYFYANNTLGKIELVTGEIYTYYLSSERLSSMTISNDTIYEYSDEDWDNKTYGKLLKETRSDGQAFAYEYYSPGNWSKVTFYVSYNVLSKTETYYEDGKLDITSYYNSQGNFNYSITYLYNEIGDYAGKINSYADGTAYEYDENNQYTKITYPNGNYYLYTERYTDGGIKIREHYNADGSLRTRWKYDENGLYTRITYENGDYCLYAERYPNGTVKRQEYYRADDNLSYVWEFYYDDMGLEYYGKKITYASGTTYEYDINNRYTKVTYSFGSYYLYLERYADGGTKVVEYYKSDDSLHTRWEYDENGLYTKVVYSNGDYDLYTERYSDGTVRTQEHYTADGNLSYTLIFMCNVETLEDFGKMIIYADGLAYRYDENNLCKWIRYSDGSFYRIFERYDDGSIKVETYLNEDGSLNTCWEYDENGLYTKVTYESGDCDLYTERYPNGEIETHEYYTADGNLSHTWEFYYDDAGVEYYGKKLTDTSGMIYEYDANDRNTKTTYSDGSYYLYLERYADGVIKVKEHYNADGSLNTRWEYDENGLYTKAVHSNGDYDLYTERYPNGELKTHEYYTADGSLSYTWMFIYNITGSEYYGKVIIYASGFRYRYDTNNRYMWIRYPDGSLYVYLERYANGNIKVEEYHNADGSLHTRWERDENGLYTKVTYENGDYDLYTERYLNGKVKKQEHYTADGNLSHTWEFYYDLTELEYLGKKLTYASGTTYDYDNQGHLVAKQDVTTGDYYTYYPLSGKIKTKTIPDGSIYQYYDEDLNRLWKITDTFGNMTEYTDYYGESQQYQFEKIYVYDDVAEQYILVNVIEHDAEGHDLTALIESVNASKVDLQIVIDAIETDNPVSVPDVASYVTDEATYTELTVMLEAINAHIARIPAEADANKTTLINNVNTAKIDLQIVIDAVEADNPVSLPDVASYVASDKTYTELTTMLDAINAHIARIPAEAAGNKTALIGTVNTAKTDLQLVIDAVETDNPVSVPDVTSYVTSDKTYAELTVMLDAINAHIARIPAEAVANKTALIGTVNTAKTDLQLVIDAVETDNPVSVPDVTSYVTSDKTYAELTVMLDAINAHIARIPAEAAANKTTLISNVNTAKTDLQLVIDAVETDNPVSVPDVTSYVTSDKTYAELTVMLDAINAHIARIPAEADTNKTTLTSNVNTAKTDLQIVIDAVETDNPVSVPDVTSYVTSDKTYTELTTMLDAINAHIARIPAEADDNKTTLISNVNTAKTDLQIVIDAVETDNPVSVPDVTSYVTSDKTYTELTTMLDELNAHIARIPAEATANKTALIGTVNTAKTDLQTVIDAVETDNPVSVPEVSSYVTDGATYSELATMLDELNAHIVRIPAEAVANKTALIGTVNTAKTDLQTVIDAVETDNPVSVPDVSSYVTDEATYAELATMLDELNAHIARIPAEATANKTALIGTVNTAKTDLQTVIDAVETDNPVSVPSVSSYVTDGATYSELATMLDELNAHIARIPAEAVANKTTLINNVNASKTELQTVIDAIDTDNPVSVPDVTSYVTSDKTYTELTTMLDIINAHIARIPAEADANKTTLISNVNTAKTELQTVIDAVETDNPVSVPSVSSYVTDDKIYSELTTMLDAINAHIARIPVEADANKTALIGTVNTATTELQAAIDNIEPGNPAIIPDMSGYVTDGKTYIELLVMLDEINSYIAQITDTDADGIDNSIDTDDDNDGVIDTEDAFPFDATETTDTDADGIGNNADLDDDNDGLEDARDAYPLDPTKRIYIDTDNNIYEYDADMRLIKHTSPDGTYCTFEEYYPETDQTRYIKSYSSDGILIDTKEYSIEGLLLNKLMLNGDLYTYYNDAENLLETKTLTAPDDEGMVYHHYLNENWDNQGYGRIDSSQRAVPLNGELFYIYTYQSDSGFLGVKKAFSEESFPVPVTRYFYYNDPLNCLAVKQFSVESPDQNGIFRYGYINEDWQGRGYGRIFYTVRSIPDEEGAQKHDYTYHDDTEIIKTKQCWTLSPYFMLLLTYEYDPSGTQISRTPGPGVTYHPSGHLESLTLSDPDEENMIYYSYLDENWNNQGFGRVEKCRRETAVTGVFGYSYTYFDDTSDRKQSITTYSDPAFAEFITTSTYFNDEAYRLESKTCATADADGMVYYRFINENWNNQGYGRVDVKELPVPNDKGIIAYSYEYHPNLDQISREIGYSDSERQIIVTVIEYNVNGEITLIENYYASGRLHSKLLPDGTICEYSDEDWNGNNYGQLIKVTNPDGSYTTYGDYYVSDNPTPVDWFWVEGLITVERETSTENVISGVSSVKITGAWLNFLQYVLNYANYIGEELTLSAWVKTTLSSTYYLGVYTGYPGEVQESNQHTGSGNWERLSLTFTMPDNSDRLLVHTPKSDNFLEADTIYIDDIRLIDPSNPSQNLILNGDLEFWNGDLDQARYIKEYNSSGVLLVTNEYDINGALISTADYYASGYMSTKTLTEPDDQGMISYSYLDENWNNQGYGRIDSSQRAVPFNDELLYQYTYHSDSGFLSMKIAFSEESLPEPVTWYSYYNDTLNSLAMKRFSIDSPDQDGIYMYRYINEDRQGRGYGRIFYTLRSVPDEEAAQRHVYMYHDDTEIIKIKECHMISPYFMLLLTYEYDPSGVQISRTPGSGVTYHPSGHLQSLTLSDPDDQGMIYYSYLDEIWNDQGFGRVEKCRSETAVIDVFGYSYTYFDDISDRKKSITTYSDIDFIEFITTSTYFNDEAYRLESKTCATADADGMVYYRFINEDWNGQSYGRIDRARREAPVNGELSYAYTYYNDPNGYLETKKCYEDADFMVLLFAYLYANEPLSNRCLSKEEICYEEGIKSKRYFTVYTDAGDRPSLLIEAFNSDGTLQSSDTYEYNDGHLTTRTYVQYNADGSTTTETTLYPHAITVDSSDYTLTYTVEGITYTENLSLNIGDNLIYRELPSYDDQWLIYVDLNIIFEQAEPMGTVTIDGGAEFTNNPTVTLSLTFMGTIPPPEMRFSVDNGNTWTNWQEIASEKVLTLSQGDGEKEVRYELRDADGDMKAFTDTIILDTIAPALGLLSDAYVYEEDYQLSYRVSDANMATTTTTESITLIRGANTITRELQDAAGNTRMMTWNIYLDLNAERGISYDYDALGNLIRQTTFNGEDITFEYDANNRLIAITYPEYPSIEIAYNNVNEITSVTDSRGDTDYTYDIAGRLNSVTLPDDQRLSYTYDLAGQITQFSYAGRVINYAYDAAGNLTSVTEGADTTTYSYNAAGDLISTTLPNGIRTSNTYNDAGNLTGICHEKVTPATETDPETVTLIADIIYTLNPAGERIRMVEVTPEGTRNVSYAYDDFKRLIREFDSSSGIIHYLYDDAGNRLSKTTIPFVITTETPREVTEYAYGIDNRLTGLNKRTYDSQEEELSNSTESFTYDAAGNIRQRITPDKVYYYEFDSRNLLTRYNDGENETTYEYDGDGNRVSKTVNGVTTYFMVDPTSSIPQVLAEMDSSGDITKTYAFGLDRLSSEEDSTTEYFLQDGLGSSIGLADSEGAISESYRYDAFGNPRFENSSQNFLYTGDQQDEETGLIYLRARYYDPTLGRFISRDPAFIGEQSETQSLNPFIYVQNDPVNYVDPWGLDAYFMKTRLSKTPFMVNGPVDDQYNTEISHEHIWFDNEHYINGIGWTKNLGFGPDGLFVLSESERTDYTLSSNLYDENVMVRAINNTVVGKYSLLGNRLLAIFAPGVKNPTKNNCQDWCYRVREQYTRLSHNENSNNDSLGSNFDYSLANLFNEFDNKSLWGTGGGGGGGDSFSSGFGDDYFGSGFDGWNSSPFDDLGGVYMNKSLSITGENLQDLHGVSYDPLTGQIIMLSNTGIDIPEIPVDYFLAALKAVFGNQGSAPGVSIDPVRDGSGNIDPSQDQTVRFLGGIENTALGQAVYEADLLMKLIAVGSDNITDTNVRPNGEDVSEIYINQYIPGFKDLFSLSEDVEDTSIFEENRSMRCWFVPKEMNLIKSDAGDAFIFDNSSVELLTETTLLNAAGGEVIPDDPRAAAFVEFFNEHFDELADLYPEFSELEKGMRAVGLAKFIKDNNIPVDLEWLSKSDFSSVTTPTTTPTVSVERIVMINGLGEEIPITISGGVDYTFFEDSNFHYLFDTAQQASGLHEATQNSRGSDTTQTWSVTMNDTEYQASAFSLAPTKKDGNFSWGGTDLAYTTSGGMPLIWQRYYDSFAAGNRTSMGNGWDYVPYALHFPVDKTEFVFILDGTESAVSIYPTIYLSDNNGGGSILFNPAGIQSEGRVFYSSEDERIGSQILYLNTDGTYTLVRSGDMVNFSSNGLLSSLMDKNQNTIDYAYDANNRLVSINDPSSALAITVTYDGNNNISQVMGPDGRSVSYVYDASTNNLSRVTQNWTEKHVDFSYDSDHRMVSAVDYSNRTLFENAYDILGRVTSQTNSLGIQVNSNSDLLTQNTQYTNTATGANSGFSYDDKFRVATSTNALGNQTQYQYLGDSFNVGSVTDAMGNNQSFEYDAFGNIISSTDAEGNTTRFYYETNGLGISRLVFTQNPDGYGTIYQYDDADNVTTTISGCRIESVNQDGSLKMIKTNLITTIAYDTKGRITQVKDANNTTTDYVYDAAGNVTQVINGEENSQVIEYLARNGIVTNLTSQVTDAIGRIFNFGYDTASDLLTSITTALGTTQYVYDSRDRQTEVIDASSRKTQFVYNPNDQLTNVIEAGDLSTTDDDISSSFIYNTLGQLVNIADPLGTVTEFGYDLAGRMINLLISETARNYALSDTVTISDVGEDIATITFDVPSNVNQIKVLYRKEDDTIYQSFIISDPAEGEYHITLEDLSGNTNYEFEIEYRDNENDMSYSRNYKFKTDLPVLPEILSTEVKNVGDTTASTKIDVSKEIASAEILYHVSGETVKKTLLTQSVSDAMENGVVIDLENLRSGMDYEAEITITDRFGVTSEINLVFFTTTGELSPEDSAIHATAGFGRVLATTTTEAYISIENTAIADPFAEELVLMVRDSQGNLVPSVFEGTHDYLGKCKYVNGLSMDSDYTYMLVCTSRGDIPPVSGSFHTPPPGDTTFGAQPVQPFIPKDATSRLFGITPIENIRMLLVTLIDTVTQVVRKYYFFDLLANIATMCLLDGLDPNRQYSIQWLMLDPSFNGTGYIGEGLPVSTPTLDETPPEVIESSIVEKTDTTVKLHFETNETLEKLTVRYRIIGTLEWLEFEVDEEIIQLALAFNIDLAGLIAGEFYEYQYVLEDEDGNQLVTKWQNW